MCNSLWKHTLVSMKSDRSVTSALQWILPAEVVDLFDHYESLELFRDHRSKSTMVGWIGPLCVRLNKLASCYLS